MLQLKIWKTETILSWNGKMTMEKNKLGEEMRSK